MKKWNILYWVVTALVLAFMLFSAIPNILVNQGSREFMGHHLGYPVYLIAFLGWAKLLGVVVILLPGLARLKEWAYAGLTFDLTGAIYSGLSVGDPLLQWTPVLAALCFIALSYYLHHKRLQSRA
ncbi:MAG TPA: DoxX family protein [Chitinophagaceae bacterium]|nr:DoxX family protein [Chitinophagaceae bacterium]